MAKSFNQLVSRTTSKRTRERADRRTRKLLGEIVPLDMPKRTVKRHRQVGQARGINK